MRRIVTLLWIGCLVMVFAMGAGQSHAQPQAQSHTPFPDTFTTVVAQAHGPHVATGHACCDEESLEQGVPLPGCSHGLHCLHVTIPAVHPCPVSRMVQPIAYPQPDTTRRLSRDPNLDLPPPRIGYLS